jgi:hypothetical protein
VEPVALDVVVIVRRHPAGVEAVSLDVIVVVGLAAGVVPATGVVAVALDIVVGLAAGMVPATRVMPMALYVGVVFGLDAPLLVVHLCLLESVARGPFDEVLPWMVGITVGFLTQGMSGSRHSAVPQAIRDRQVGSQPGTLCPWQT